MISPPSQERCMLSSSTRAVMLAVAFQPHKSAGYGKGRIWTSLLHAAVNSRPKKGPKNFFCVRPESKFPSRHICAVCWASVVGRPCPL